MHVILYTYSGNYAQEIRDRGAPIAIEIRLNAMRNLLLVLDFLDRQLVQPNLTSNLLTTGSVLGTGLVSKEAVDLEVV